MRPSIATPSRVVLAAARDFHDLPDGDVVAESCRTGASLLGAAHWVVVEHVGGKASLRCASSLRAAERQEAAMSHPDSPLRRCLDGSATVAAEFHPSNGWFDPHGAESLNAGIHHEYAFCSGRGRAGGDVFVWSRTHELAVGVEELDATEMLVVAAGLRLGFGRSLAAAATLVGQLETALANRATIEQAKGLVAGRDGIGLDAAFEGLRGAARSSGRRLLDVAAEVLSGPSAAGVTSSVATRRTVTQPGTMARRTGRSQPG